MERSISPILNIAQSYHADEQATVQGVSGLDLMEKAGQAVTEAIVSRWQKRPVMVLVGPGNNGGDGFVIARLLTKAGWSVSIYMLGAKSALKGDAAINAKRWRGKIFDLEAAFENISKPEQNDDTLIIDALFGAGLSKPLKGFIKDLAQKLKQRRKQSKNFVVVAVDMPSGVHGDTGQILGDGSFAADLTVTFGNAKPGHYLMPGRGLCGELVMADIGIPDQVVSDLKPKTFLNSPGIWIDQFPQPHALGHKYNRGHVVVLGGDEMSGAARLVALAARRMGAGLVTVSVSKKMFPVYASTLEPGTLLKTTQGLKGFCKIIKDPRKTTCVLGPGAGLYKKTAEKVLSALKANKNCVLDADALSVFQNDPETLFKALYDNTGQGGLTPHAGEFLKLFPDLAQKQKQYGKLAITIQAAKRAGCVVVYKGVDTVIAAPDGHAVLNANAPPTLATAGTGDVLAGFMGGLVAQGMPVFKAAQASVWLHAECANLFGLGLVAEDLIDMLPEVLNELFAPDNGK